MCPRVHGRGHPIRRPVCNQRLEAEMQCIQLVHAVISPQHPQLHALPFLHGLDLEISDTPEHAACRVWVQRRQCSVRKEVLDDQLRRQASFDSPEFEAPILKGRVGDYVVAITAIQSSLHIKHTNE